MRRLLKGILGIAVLAGIGVLLVWAFLEGRAEIARERERERRRSFRRSSNHRFKSEKNESMSQGEIAVMSQRKGWGFHWRGRIGGIVLFPFGALVLLSTSLIPEGSGLDLAADALAWVSFVAGTTFRLWATLYIGGRKDRAVASEGPYSMCRNPLYIGSFFLALSAVLFLKSLAFAAGLVLAVFAYASVTVPAEESFLRERLGEEYVRYCQRVPRYWPCLRLFHTPEIIEVRVKALRLEWKRASRWAWLPLLGEIIAHLRHQPWWPHLLRLP